jgi:DNA topoisomerase IB
MATLAQHIDAPQVSGAYKVDLSRGRNIGRVSSEWYSRPDDEKFLSLDDLYENVRRRADCARTRIVESRDVRVEAGVIDLDFPAKSGVRARIRIEDEDLAVVLEQLTAGRPRSPLLAYRRGRRRVPLTPGEVNAYIRVLTGGDFTAKDFRTLRGTVTAAENLARLGHVETKKARKLAERDAVKATAAVLCNTPSVARSSYIDPRVWRAYAKGRLLESGVSPETAIRRLVEG